MTAFRLARPEDAEALSLLHGDIFAASGWAPDFFRTAAKMPHQFCLLMEGETAPLALIACQVIAPEAEILTMGVHPSARRSGLGQQLLAETFSALATRGATDIFLEVREDNAPAISLYRAAGFTPHGQRLRYYEDGTDAVLMRTAILLEADGNDE